MPHRLYHRCRRTPTFTDTGDTVGLLTRDGRKAAHCRRQSAASLLRYRVAVASLDFRRARCSSATIRSRRPRSCAASTDITTRTIGFQELCSIRWINYEHCAIRIGLRRLRARSCWGLTAATSSMATPRTAPGSRQCVISPTAALCEFCRHAPRKWLRERYAISASIETVRAAELGRCWLRRRLQRRRRTARRSRHPSARSDQVDRRGERSRTIAADLPWLFSAIPTCGPG